MDQLKLTTQEAYFINKITEPCQSIMGKGIDLELLKSLLAQKVQTPMVPTAVVAMVEEILFKIMSHQADLEIEKMLKDPNYGKSGMNSKIQSFYRMTNLTAKHVAILNLVQKHPELSRADIADRLNVPINRVTPRVLELIKMGKLKVTGTTYDHKTGRNVQTLSPEGK
jgi:DNA-binding MarR family transcriptional regulator